MGLHHLRDIMGNKSSQGKRKRDAPEVTLGRWERVVKNKVVGVDISVFYHSLFSRKTDVCKMLSVNPNTSVFYLVAQRMRKWFKQRQLYHAKAAFHRER